MSKLSLKGTALQTFGGMDTKKSNFFRGNGHKNIFHSYCLIEKHIVATVSELHSVFSSSFFITTRPQKSNTNRLFSYNSPFIHKLKTVQATISKGIIRRAGCIRDFQFSINPIGIFLSFRTSQQFVCKKAA